MDSHRRDILQKVVESDPAAWMEENFWIEDPRDPETGEIFEPGPIRLIEAQRKILRYGLTRINDEFPFATFLYSTIKKSGKTRIAAAVAAWWAKNMGSYGEIYCLANDGKQSKDRILSAIRKSVELNPDCHWHKTKSKITLPNGTFIEAIPCDPTGQAGSNPSLTVWSELWGAQYKHQERLWSEMTIPPTRSGRAMRFVESYAGFTGESHVLENLYNLGVNDGIRHPAFRSEDDPPVYVNTRAKLYCYWDEGPEARRLPWQNEDYYQEQAATLRPSEFSRIHENKWADPVEKAIPIEWWDRCQATEIYKDRIPPLDSRTPIVVGLDAAISKDCCALVAVSRNPFLKQRDSEYNKQAAVRIVRVWEPPIGGKIDLTETLEKALKEIARRYNVIMAVYDEYQLAKMASDISKEGRILMKAFSQASLRARADNDLHTMIVHRRIIHNGQHILRTHVDNAAAKTTGDKLRFVKRDEGESFGRTRSPIDALVALSMATYKSLRLVL